MITFMNEMDNEVCVGITYEWIPQKCNHCHGIGHSTEVCRNKVVQKQTWVPKKIQKDKEITLDEDGFQPVSK